MALASYRPTRPMPLSFEEILAQYGANNRYELIDGQLFDLEPTGPHGRAASLKTMEVALAGSITTSCSKGPITAFPIAA